jgi:hypothetical protein
MIYGRGPGIQPENGIQTEKIGINKYLSPEGLNRYNQYQDRQWMTTEYPSSRQSASPLQQGQQSASRQGSFQEASGQSQNDDLLHRRTVAGPNADMWLGGEDPQHIARTSGLNPSPRANPNQQQQQ